MRRCRSSHGPQRRSVGLFQHAGLIADPLWRRLVVVGFLGGYTTFSSYTYEALALAEQGDWRRAAAYVLGSNGLGLVACYAGMVVARAVGR